MRRLPLFLALLLACLPSTVAAGEKPLVLITAVHISGSTSTAELTVKKGPVDLAALMVTDMEGVPTVLAESSRTLATGAIIKLHWEKHTSPEAGSISIPAHVLSATDDQLLVLLDGAPHDAVVWTNGDGEMAKAEQADLDALVRDGMWKGNTQADAVPLPADKRIRRVAAVDTDSKADWGAGAALPPESDPGLPGAGASDILLLTLAGVAVLRGGGRFLRRFLG